MQLCGAISALWLEAGRLKENVHDVLDSEVKPKYDCSADMWKIVKYDNNNKNNVFLFGNAASNEACDSFELFSRLFFIMDQDSELSKKELHSNF